MSRKRLRSSPPCSQPTASSSSSSSSTLRTLVPCITCSEPFKDGDTTFVALFSPTLSPRTLQSDPNIASASHRTLAWRKRSPQRTLLPLQKNERLYDLGYDDDGERYAGVALEALLERLRVEGSVVVARYGGIPLGPARLAHVETVARDAIAKATAAKVARNVSTSRGDVEEEGPSKKSKQAEMKLDARPDVDELRSRVAKVLEDQDETVEVLRDLLARNKEIAAAEVKGDEVGDGAKEHQHSTFKELEERAEQLHNVGDTHRNFCAVSQMSSSKAPPFDYKGMPLSVMQRQKKVREATIAWLLKEIDKD